LSSLRAELYEPLLWCIRNKQYEDFERLEDRIREIGEAKMMIKDRYGI